MSARVLIIIFLSFVTAYSEEQHKTLKWENLPKTELTERSEYASVLYNDKLIIWGGVSVSGGVAKYLSDGAMLDLKTMKWKELPQIELAGRVFHTLVVYDDKLIVWGGTDRKEYFSDGAMLDLKEMKWKELPKTELAGRIRHTSVLYNDKLIIWGGTGLADCFSDGAMLDLKEMKWKELPKPKLAGRWGHTSIIYTDKLIIWGGGGGDVVGEGYLSDGAMLDLKEMKWKELPKPELEGRDFPNSVIYTDKLIVWGGKAFADCFSDGAMLDLKEMKWQKLPEVNLEKRAGNTFILYDDKLIIWGGAPGISNAGEFFSDGAMLDLKEMKWKELPKTELKGRMGHTSIIYNDKLIVWGGTNMSEYFSDGAMLDLKEMKWSELPETKLAGRWGHTSIVYNDKLIIWGGTGGVNDTEWHFSDGAMLDLKALTALKDLQLKKKK